MYQHVMFFQGSTLSKGFSTHLTFLTFLFLMIVIDMRFQVKILLTPMITIVTFVRSFFFMHTFDSRLKLYFTLNVLPHWWHSKRLILSVWWIFKCLVRFPLLTKLLPKFSHSLAFSWIFYLGLPLFFLSTEFECVSIQCLSYISIFLNSCWQIVHKNTAFFELFSFFIWKC